jgi:DinB superfamily
MSSIRAAFPTWPDVNQRLLKRVAKLSPEQLAIVPGPGRWPLWASIGHLACQRIFGLCDVAGAPGAPESPFPNAAWNCPGDDDLERVWTADELVDALGRTFSIVDHCLDTWTLASLDEVVRHPEWGHDHERSRGASLERTFAHDVWHIAELNEALTAAGLEQVDLWS